MLDESVNAVARKLDPSCAVLVCSSDGYEDLWQPFFFLFLRHWFDCPFPIYLGAGSKMFSHPRVETLNSADLNWTAAFRSFLSQIDSDYVLVLLEDFFIRDRVDTGIVLECLQFLATSGGVMLRLVPKPGPDIALSQHTGIGQLHKDAPYRVSLQASIWRRADLLQLLRDGESAWEFEWQGTERSRQMNAPFFAVKNPVLHYDHVVERGQWFWAAARKYRGERIGCDFTKRGVMNPFIAAKKALNRMRKTATDSVLPPVRRRRQ